MAPLAGSSFSVFFHQGGTDGTLLGARNIVESVRHNIGHYEVAFKHKSVKRCAFNAIPSGPGVVSANLGSLPNSVRVEIRDHHGRLTDTGFYLMAVC